MDQVAAGVIAGLIGGLAVLVLALIGKRRKKAPGEIPPGKEWNKLLMSLMFVLTGLLPLVGLVLGIVGLSIRPKRKQGMFLVSFSVGLTVMFVLAKPVYGRIFGVLTAILFSIYFGIGKYTLKSIAIAVLVLVALSVGCNMLIHTDYVRNYITDPLLDPQDSP